MNEIRLDTTELDRIAKGLDVNMVEVVESLAFDIEKEAKEIVTAKNIIKTGALRASIYTATKHSNGYTGAAIAATEKNFYVDTIPHPTPTGKVIANVGPAVNYAAFIELGTRFMRARAFLLPAVESVAKKLNDGRTWERLFKK